MRPFWTITHIAIYISRLAIFTIDGKRNRVMIISRADNVADRAAYLQPMGGMPGAYGSTFRFRLR